MTKNILKTFVAGTVCAVLATFSVRAQDFSFVASLRKHVDSLAGENMHGRLYGTEYERIAGDYVWDRFSEASLEMLSARDGGGFSLNISGEDINSRNIAAVVQGYDPQLRNRYVVIGAHLDNVGENIMTVNGHTVTQTFYGANDDASGLAMLVELARVAAENSFMFRRSLVFVAFGASEQMHSGAWYFLNGGFSDSSSIDMMINLDMLGHCSDGLFIYTGSNSGMSALSDSLGFQMRPLRAQVVYQDYYTGDHRVFMNTGIPSALFTSGPNLDYRTTRDSPDKLDYESMAQAADYIYGYMMACANLDTPPVAKPSKGASADEDPSAPVYSLYECSERPSFFNGANISKFLTEWVYKYQKYPRQAIEQGVQGTVMVSFVVEKSGHVTNVKVVDGVHPLLDEEALRIVSASPKWKPGRINGNKVRCRISIPIEFRLVGSDSKHFGLKR